MTGSFLFFGKVSTMGCSKKTDMLSVYQSL